MPFQSAPGTIHITLRGTWAGQDTINDLYFHQEGVDPTFSDVLALTDLIATWWDGALKPLTNESFTLNEVVGRGLTTVISPMARTFVALGQGGVSGEAVPNNVNPAITFQSDIGGRSGHGRNFIPGMSNSDVTGNFLESAQASSLVEAYAQLLPGGSMDPAPWKWSVLSRQAFGVVLPTATAYGIIAVSFTDLVVDSQRRRLPGRGR